MAKYANQKTITIHTEAVSKESSRCFTTHYIDNIQNAMQILTPSAFKIYMYLICHKNSFQLDFSPAHAYKMTDLSDNTCRRALLELEEKGYIEPDSKNPNLLNFYECSSTTNSIGEANIAEILHKHNITFISDRPYFEDCCGDKRPLRFDFILLDENNKPYRLIEFDGMQHKRPYFGDEELPVRQQYDKIKNDYARANNLPLVRIPYHERDNITLQMLFGDKYLVK